MFEEEINYRYGNLYNIICFREDNIKLFWYGILSLYLEKEKIITENNELYVLRYESTWPDYSAIKKYKCVTFFIRKKEPVEVNVISS